MYSRSSSWRKIRRDRPVAPRAVTDGRGRLAPVAAAVLVGVSWAMAGTAHAQPGCYARDSQLYCGNDAPTPIYAQASFGREDASGGFRPTPVVDTLKTNPSSFKCWVHGEQHSGGNDIWYYTNGDVTGRWGYVPAVKVYTTMDPLAGVAACGQPQPRPQQQTQPTPAAPTPCALASYQTKYLGYRRSFGLDHSILRLSWQPDLCKAQSGRYDVKDPTLEVIGPGSVGGQGLKLRAAERTDRGVTYRGDIRECTPFSVSYEGIGFSGTGCRTVGRAEITATATASGVHVDYRASRLRWASMGYGKWVWTDAPL